MPQRPHVPKFGDWDSDNIPYTTYFEKARNEKDKDGKMFNPNDPEENPNAFSHRTDHLEDNGGHHVVRALPSHLNSGPIEHVTNNQDREGHIPRSPRTERGLNQQRNPKSPTTESPPDISSSDRSLIPSANHRTRSSQKKSPGEGSNNNNNSFPPSPPSRTKGGSGHSADHQHQQHHRVASVPKFGAWDETDPRSGEGFTVIFNKVKQEKQNGATRFPTTVPELSVYPNGQKHRTSPSKAKMCCCFSWRSDK